MELEPRANLQPRSKEIAGRVRRWFEFGAADFIVAPQPHETLSGPPSRIKHYQGVVLRSLEHIVLMSLSVRLRALRLYVTRFQFNASAARACHCTAYGVAHFARVSMKTITNTCDMRQRSWWQTSVEPSNSLYIWLVSIVNGEIWIFTITLLSFCVDMSRTIILIFSHLCDNNRYRNY